ncbi:MAG: hypothetical protein HZB10_01495 [Candidatus Yonathbacteria bacterium]|nr:hypothetical protein [Candidatus Yonathbacteria bacterium]
MPFRILAGQTDIALALRAPDVQLEGRVPHVADLPLREVTARNLERRATDIAFDRRLPLRILPAFSQNLHTAPPRV